MTPLNEQPTHRFARDLLGDPDKLLDSAGLSYEQKLGLVLVRITDDAHHHKEEHTRCEKEGCASVQTLGRKLAYLFGGIAGFSALMAFLMFLWTVTK